MASGLFIRAVKKADHLYNAMESRCYTGDIRVLEQDYAPKAAEITAMACFDLLMLGLYFGMRTTGRLL
jgi:cobalt/nickel transport system permease protein